MRRICLILVVLTLVTPVLRAQEDPVFAGFVAVDLVLVDVQVEDRSGNPVLDLKREDFRLYRDGEPMEISQFTAPRQPAGQTGSQPDPSLPAATTPRRLIIFVDNLHLRASSRMRVFDKLARVLDSYLATEDEVMLVTYGGTTRVVLEMTRNRKTLKKALLEQAEAGTFSLLTVDGENERTLEAIQYIRSIDARIQGAPGPCLEVEHLAHGHAEQVYTRVLGTVSELDRFVNSLAGYEGPKALLHVSDGIPLVAGSEAYRYASELCDGTGVNAGLPNAGYTAQGSPYWDPTKTAATLQDFDTTEVWSRLASHANTYQVSFYTFQARQRSDRSSTVTDTRTSMGVEMEGARNRQDALFMLADETGGAAMLDANDVEPALARMEGDSRARYQLAFEPPASGDGRQHQIRVEVVRPDVRVRHRKSYSSKPADQRVEDQVISALMHGLSDNPLGVRVEIGEDRQVERGMSHVRVRVSVPLDRIVLLPEDGSKRGLFSVFLAVRNSFDQVSPIGRKIVPVNVPLTPTEDEFVYTVEVPVRGENGVIAVAVQDNLGAEVSYLARGFRLQG